MKDQAILLQGVRHHNLKNIDLALPKYQLVVITGLSGSGKSSLAFETLYAEGQRRYLETLSTYARQFIRQMEKPDLDRITGIPPAIALEQKKVPAHPRSTVGTLTEVYDHFRLLYARVGTPYCPQCEIALQPQTLEQMLALLFNRYAGQLVAITAPIVRGRKGIYRRELDRARKQGYTWARIDSAWYRLESPPRLARNRHHDIDIVVDRVRVQADRRERLRTALQQAVAMAQGFARAVLWEGEGELFFSTAHHCPRCGYQFPALEPWFFAFSSPKGACLLCQGVGWVTPGLARRWREEAVRWEELPSFQQWLLWRDWNEEDELPSLAERTAVCPQCQGTRLRPETRWVRIDGRNIAEIHAMEIQEVRHWLEGLRFEGTAATIAGRVLDEIRRRLDDLQEVGVGYLTLDRMVHTLSTGEIQRVRLAAQMGSRLRGVLYVLDEPTVGLHPRDTQRLLNLLRRLRDLGNTIVVVEHDEATIRAADTVIDLGPGAGEQGGHVVAMGTVEAITKHPDSLTGAYLSGRRTLPERKRLSLDDVQWLVLKGAHKHNLRNLTVKFPLNRLIAVTGVSGSGKSTLVLDVLYPELHRALSRKEPVRFRYCRSIDGYESLRAVYYVDQSPIGRTPRSCPATYIGIFSDIRNLFAAQETARMWGYGPGRFSFNVKEGQCRFCKGMGFRRVKMHFMPDVYVHCETCDGKRYNPDTLKVVWHGRTIADILELTVDEAREVFAFHRGIHKKLQILHELALGYLRLGQPSHTLSGGESQRLKLARELGRAPTGRNLYILDEPTTGLHAEDVRYLLNVLDRLVAAGHTVIVIEHHLDIIRNADYIIDLGPEGGSGGGRVVVAGPPEAVAAHPDSRTGAFLAGRRAVPLPA